MRLKKQPNGCFFYVRRAGTPAAYSNAAAAAIEAAPKASHKGEMRIFLL
jgi:hypothetical protein